MSRFYEVHHQDGSVSDMILIEGTDPHEEIKKWEPEQRATVAHIQAVTAFRDRSHEVAPPNFAEASDDVKNALLHMGGAMVSIQDELAELRAFKEQFLTEAANVAKGKQNG